MACPIGDVRTALERYGPDRCDAVGEPEARAWCRALAWGHYENFSVLSSLVPKELRDDFGAVYAFCRWSDDLGDEIGSRERSLELLAWWRGELEACLAGHPRHPVFVALAPTIRRHDLPGEPFDRLIRAFERDQVQSRYATWDDLIDYCRGSADPVGRIVLMLLGEPREESLFALSDRICTALQLTNHWQDIRRDFVERDRIYVPADLVSIADFERRLGETIRLGHSCDKTFFDESRKLVRSLVARTWTLFEEGEALLDRLGARSMPLVWLLAAGGCRTLQQIELWNCETVLHRPYLSKFTKLLLVIQAQWMRVTGSRPAPSKTPSHPAPAAVGEAGGAP